MKIGIFGGTFNPPHLGHLYMADQLREVASLDKILVIPDHTPPHKDSSGVLATSDQRLDMCRLTFSADYYEVSDIDARREGRSYSIYLVERLKAVYPSDELTFIMGSDMLLSFKRWYRWRDILRLVSLTGVSRCDEDTFDEIKEFAQTEISPYGRAFVYEIPPYELSSTQIRLAVRDGADVSGFLESRTAEYIIANRLYQEECNC